MKKVLVTFIALLAIVISAVAADNAANKTISVEGKARIITPITLANSSALDFGVIAKGTNDATVVVAASATPSINVATGDAVVLTSTPQTAAKFTVSGELGKTYAITIPTGTQTITSGSNHLDITNFSCSIVSQIGTIAATNDFYVGGTLAVPAATNPGSYTGNFNVTVAYN